MTTLAGLHAAILTRTTLGQDRLTRRPLEAVQVTDATGHEVEPGAEPESWPEILTDATLVCHLGTQNGVSLYRVDYHAAPACFYLVR